ncbi:MAG: hypothetical protein HN712_27885 [Gemmatimonadetes bacterium]|jgi:hypothetical protein|nr:hypothetical protein [Gemmatimonadota bacterium]MBT6147239.1 hypothetical protein [Gemmatimonadota bacterium]MBT7864164.1 hypothetical protein [Gemmatimonadota bacterium]
MMGLIIPVAIVFVGATVVAAIITGSRLGASRKMLFQLETAAGQLRRQLDEMEQEKRQTAGRIRALRRLREDKVLALETLYAELKAFTSPDARQIGVSAGLAPRSLEMETVAA